MPPLGGTPGFCCVALVCCEVALLDEVDKEVGAALLVLGWEVEGVVVPLDGVGLVVAPLVALPVVFPPLPGAPPAGMGLDTLPDTLCGPPVVPACEPIGLGMGARGSALDAGGPLCPGGPVGGIPLPGVGAGLSDVGSWYAKLICFVIVSSCPSNWFR